MKRIELMGPSGVGKTTLLNEMIKQRSRKEKWLSLNEARACIAKSIKSKDVISGEYLKKFLLNAGGPKWIQKKIGDNVLSPVAEEALLLKQNEWFSYLEFCASQIGSLNKHPLYRIYIAKWLESILSNVALTELYNSSYQIIFPASLSQRAPDLLPWDHTTCFKECQNYFKLIPDPFAVIYLDAKPEQIAERIIERSKVKKFSIQHYGLKSNEILERSKSAKAIFQIGVEVLRERGIKVIALNADQNSKIMVAELKTFLTSL